MLLLLLLLLVWPVMHWLACSSGVWLLEPPAPLVLRLWPRRPERA